MSRHLPTYAGSAMAAQQVVARVAARRPGGGEEAEPARFWVRDFDIADPEWPEGYELRHVDDGPYEREAAQAVATAFNQRRVDRSIEFRVCEGASPWARRSDGSEG